MSAFDGVRVVELGQGIAGPLVGMFLGDFGADVVKIEPPDGDPSRAAAGFPMWNRNKRSVVVDPEDRARCRWLADLVAGADVLQVSERRVLERYGLDAGVLTAGNPRLVVVLTPPYEGTAPWRDDVESDGLLAAATGVALRQSSYEGGPVESVYPHQLYIQGALAATATVAALIERERSGFGQTVTVSGVNAVVETSMGSLTTNPANPDPVSAVGPGGPNPFYTRYQAADGAWFFVGALVPPAMHRFLDGIGLRDEILGDERIAGDVAGVISLENRGWVRERFIEAIRTEPRDVWLARFEKADNPTGPLLARDAWLDHQQFRAIGMRSELDDPERGHVVMPSNPLVLTGTPWAVRRPAPRLGEHDADVALWPAPRVPVGSPPRSAGPLAGCRILNLGTYLAGPYAGVLLSDLGAEVVKIEPPAGDPFRSAGFAQNRGMRSVALDLRDPAAQEAFLRLVQSSDAVVDNSRSGVLERLRADHATLAMAKGDVVTMSLTGFGEGGPLSHRPGFDPVMQAMSGMMLAQGGDSEPVMFTIPINDVTSAVLLALGTCIGIFHHARTGQGQRMWTSLVGASAYMQSGELVRYEGRPPAPRGGRDHLGSAPLDRYYAVSDGWVRLRVPEGFDPLRLVEAGLVDDAGNFSADPAASLSAGLAGLSRQDAADRLNAAGVAATPARAFRETREDKALQQAEFVYVCERPSDGLVYFSSGRYGTFERTQRSGPLSAPGIGEHTREVLASAGVTDAAVDELIAGGASLQGAPAEPVFSVSYR